MNLFVCGTDTGVGKTVASAVLCLKLGAHYWKPVQSGMVDGETDSEWVARYVGVDGIRPETYLLPEPLSPHLSAALASAAIDVDLILAEAPVTPTVIEGAGGVLTPLNDRALFADLMRAFAVPTVLVARTSLGTINHTLLSLEALRRREIEPAGVLLAGEPNAENRAAIEHFGLIQVLGEIPPIHDWSRENLIRLGREITLPGKAAAPAPMPEAPLDGRERVTRRLSRVFPIHTEIVPNKAEDKEPEHA